MAEKTTATKKKTANKKARPTLSQQVKTQAELIAQVTAELEQKKEELAELTEKSEQYAAKLEKTQKEKQQKTRQNTKYKNEIESLKQSIEIREKTLSDAAAQSKVKNHIIAGMALSLIPMPLLDVAALTATQLNLLRSLCDHYKVNFDEQKGKALLNALISGTLPVASIVGLSSVIKVVPGIGTIGGGIGMATTSGITTYATGEVFIKHFSDNGTLDNFDSSRWQLYFKEKLEEGKQLVHARMPSVTKSEPETKSLASAN